MVKKKNPIWRALYGSHFTPTEDAKRLAIKEEQYDPGYEDAYGGAYVEKTAEEGQAEGQSNGHCSFSSAENKGSQKWLMTCHNRCLFAEQLTKTKPLIIYFSFMWYR